MWRGRCFQPDAWMRGGFHLAVPDSGLTPAGGTRVGGNDRYPRRGAGMGPGKSHPAAGASWDPIPQLVLSSSCVVLREGERRRGGEEAGMGYPGLGS